MTLTSENSDDNSKTLPQIAEQQISSEGRMPIRNLSISSRTVQSHSSAAMLEAGEPDLRAGCNKDGFPFVLTPPSLPDDIDDLPTHITICPEEGVSITRAIKAVYEDLDARSASGQPERSNIIKTEELIFYGEDQIRTLRTEAILRCAGCGGIVYIRSPRKLDVNDFDNIEEFYAKRDQQKPGLMHSSGVPDGFCPWTEERANTGISAQIYGGRRPSAVHEELKGWVHSILSQDYRFISHAEQEVRAYSAGRRYRQADILAKSRSGSLWDIEIQATPPLLSALRPRTAFWVRHDVRPLWLVPEEVIFQKGIPAGFLDLSSVHGRTLLAITAESQKESELQGRLLFDAYTIEGRNAVFSERLGLRQIQKRSLKNAPYQHQRESRARDHARFNAQQVIIQIEEGLQTTQEDALEWLDAAADTDSPIAWARKLGRQKLLPPDTSNTIYSQGIVTDSQCFEAIVLALFALGSAWGELNHHRRSSYGRKIGQVLKGLAREPLYARFRRIILDIITGSDFGRFVDRSSIDELIQSCVEVQVDHSLDRIAQIAFPGVLRPFSRDHMGRRDMLLEWESRKYVVQPWEEREPLVNITWKVQP